MIARPNPAVFDVVADFKPRLNSVRKSLSCDELPGKAVAFSTNASQSTSVLKASTSCRRTAHCRATAHVFASSAVIGLVAVCAGVLAAFAGGTALSGNKGALSGSAGTERTDPIQAARQRPLNAKSRRGCFIGTTR